jgi:hypothetical protein
MRSLPLVLAAFALAPAAAAQTAPADPAAAQAEAPAKKERKICRYEQATESRLGGKRICKTAAEWKAQDSSVDIRQLQQQSSRSY